MSASAKQMLAGLFEGKCRRQLAKRLAAIASRLAFHPQHLEMRHLPLEAGVETTAALPAGTVGANAPNQALVQDQPQLARDKVRIIGQGVEPLDHAPQEPACNVAITR